MKKAVFVIGLIFIIVGTILAYLGRTSTQTIQQLPRIASSITYGQSYSTTWSLDGNFSEGEYVGVDFRPASDWSLPQFDEEILPPVNGTLYEAVKRLEVNVTNQQGNFTSFTIYLVITSPYGGAEHVTIFPDYFNITSQGGALIVEKDYPKPEIIKYNNTHYSMILLGKTTSSGTYNISFLLDYKIMDAVFEDNKTKLWIHDPRLPPYVWIYGVQENVEIDYPYSSLTYIGPLVVASGVILLIYSLLTFKKRKSTEHRLSPKSKRKNF